MRVVAVLVVPRTCIGRNHHPHIEPPTINRLACKVPFVCRAVRKWAVVVVAAAVAAAAAAGDVRK